MKHYLITYKSKGIKNLFLHPPPYTYWQIYVKLNVEIKYFHHLIL